MISIVLMSTIFVIGLILLYFYRFYSNIKKYPPGPLPLPIVGNLLLFITKRDKTIFTMISDFGQTYGSLYTLWLGSKPAVVILDLDLGKEAFNKITLNGRPESNLECLFSGRDFKSISFMDYNKESQALRKVAIESLRTLLNGKTFSLTVSRIIEETVNRLVITERDKAFSPNVYVEKLIQGIIFESGFNHKYNFDDKELDIITHTFELFNKEGMKLMLTDFLPITKYFLKASMECITEINKLTDYYRNKFESHLKAYETGNTDTICDSIITATNTLTNDGKDSAKYLSKHNLIGLINAMFAGSLDTTIATFKWIILFMAYYPEMQEKLRTEVKEKIGDRLPELSDKSNCHYLNAFISETLRFRNPLAIGVFHKTTENIEISGIAVPKNTTVFLHQQFILNSPKYWSEPEKFNPNRFIDSSGIYNTRFPAFIPFSTGKRVCPGERMANYMAFLVLANLLQKTNKYQFALPREKQNVDLNPNFMDFVTQPKYYEIVLKNS